MKNQVLCTLLAAWPLVAFSQDGFNQSNQSNYTSSEGSEQETHSAGPDTEPPPDDQQGRGSYSAVTVELNISDSKHLPLLLNFNSGQRPMFDEGYYPSSPGNPFSALNNSNDSNITWSGFFQSGALEERAKNQTGTLKEAFQQAREWLTSFWNMPASLLAALAALSSSIVTPEPPMELPVYPTNSSKSKKNWSQKLDSSDDESLPEKSDEAKELKKLVEVFLDSHNPEELISWLEGQNYFFEEVITDDEAHEVKTLLSRAEKIPGELWNVLHDKIAPEVSIQDAKVRIKPQNRVQVDGVEHIPPPPREKQLSNQGSLSARSSNFLEPTSEKTLLDELSSLVPPSDLDVTVLDSQEAPVEKELKVVSSHPLSDSAYNDVITAISETTEGDIREMVAALPSLPKPPSSDTTALEEISSSEAETVELFPQEIDLGWHSVRSDGVSFKDDISRAFLKQLQSFGGSFRQEPGKTVISFRQGMKIKHEYTHERLDNLPDLHFLKARQLEWSLSDGALLIHLYSARFLKQGFYYLVQILANPESPFFNPFVLEKIAREFRAAQYPEREYEMLDAYPWPTLSGELETIFQLLIAPTEEREALRDSLKMDLMEQLKSGNFHLGLTVVLIRLNAFKSSKQDMETLRSALQQRAVHDQGAAWILMTLPPTQFSMFEINARLASQPFYYFYRLNMVIGLLTNGMAGLQPLHEVMVSLRTTLGSSKLGVEQLLIMDDLLYFKPKALMLVVNQSIQQIISLYGEGCRTQLEVIARFQQFGSMEHMLMQHTINQMVAAMSHHLDKMIIFTPSLVRLKSYHELEKLQSPAATSKLTTEDVKDPYTGYYDRLLAAWRHSKDPQYRTWLAALKKDPLTPTELKEEIAAALKAGAPP